MDDERIAKLIVGDLEPQTYQDKVFLFAYKHALDGQNLIDVKEKMISELDKLNLDELWCFVFGYSIGQKHSFQAEEEARREAANGKFH